jgi:uncharacterized phage protein (TIGR01671 family)
MQNREIKFRFWTGDKMFVGIENVMDCLKQQIHFNADNGSKLGYDHIGIHKSAFMQYTGLKDKNGKEIYEGDIMKHDDGSICQIVFDKMLLIGDLDNDVTILGYLRKWKDGTYSPIGYFGTPDWVVIGNIYENPELINS